MVSEQISWAVNINSLCIWTNEITMSDCDHRSSVVSIGAIGMNIMG